MIQSVKYFCIGFFFFIQTLVIAQSIAVEDVDAVTAGVQTDVQVGPGGFTSSKGMTIDIHKKSGISVVAWTDADAVGSSNKNVYCQIFDKNWRVLMPAFLVNTKTNGDQVALALKVNQKENSFVIAWSSNHGTDGNYDVYFKKLNLYQSNAADALAINEDSFKVNTYTSGIQYAPFIAFDYDQDEVLFTWREYNGNDGSGMGTYATRFSNYTLKKAGSDFLVNQATANNQAPFGIEVSPLTNELLIIYNSNADRAADADIYIRRFKRNSLGVFIGAAEERLNNNATYLTSSQWAPTLSMNYKTGAYCIVWNSDNQDGSARGIIYKVFNSDKTIAKDETIATVVTSGNQYTAKTVWDEETGYLIHYYFSGVGNPYTMNYQIVTNTYAFYGTQQVFSPAVDVNSFDAGWSIASNPVTHRTAVGYHIYQSGSGLSNAYIRSLNFIHPSQQAQLNTCSTDNTRTWDQETVYDEYGNIISEARVYYDKLSRPVQVQQRNIDKNNILAKAFIYDKFGRKAITTLPAPTNQRCFTYNANFITDINNHAYTDQYFDVAVSNTTPGTLGWYYSDNNTLEPYVATTKFPYSRTLFADSTFGGMTQALLPGDTTMIGRKSMRAGVSAMMNELDSYAATRNQSIATPGTMANQGVKIVSVDVNGVQQASYVNKDGEILSEKSKNPNNPSAYTTSTLTLKPYYHRATIPRGQFNTTYQYFTSNITAQCADSIVVLANTQACTMLYNGDPKLFKHGGYPDHAATDIPFIFFSKQRFIINYDSISPYDYRPIAPQPLPSESFNKTISSRSSTSTNQSLGSFFLSDKTGFSLNLSKAPSWLKIRVTNLDKSLQVYAGLASSFNASSLTNGYTYKIEIISLDYCQLISSYYSSNPNTFFAALDSVYIKINYRNPFTHGASNYYDDNGETTSIATPGAKNTATNATLALSTKYTQSSGGLTLSETNADSKTTNFVYRSDGKIRFKQNNKQKQSGRFTYYNYDRYGRLIEEGEYIPALDPAAKSFETQKLTPSSPTSVLHLLENISPGGGLGGASCTCRSEATSYRYSVPDLAIPVARIQRFTEGKVSRTSSATISTWYSYDESGHIEWIVRAIPQFGGATKLITIDYRYDVLGNLLNVYFQNSSLSERFEHRYTYTDAYTLQEVQTKALSNSYQSEVSYEYYLHGPLKREELADSLQGIDYSYTVQGYLKSINHATLNESKDAGRDGFTSGIHKKFGRDVFGLQFEYFNGDYSRSGSNIVSTTPSVAQYGNFYDGTIKAMRWQTRGQAVSGNMPMYAFTYDSKYQLKGADFGTVSAASESVFTASVSNSYRIKDLAYDDNGNILSMTKLGQTGANYDAFTMEYTNNNNQLTGVKITGTSTYYAQYTYDSIGNVSSIYKNGQYYFIDYNSFNLPSAVYQNGSKTIKRVTFSYDEFGHRLSKVTYNSSGSYLYTTWYVTDASGTVMAIYDDRSGTLGQTELPVYGTERIGTAYKSGSSYNYAYELKDHLGNIRATIARVRTGADPTILSWADYYAFGDIMPGRSFVSSTSGRYGFAGKYAEVDAEMDWLAFDMRMYDARTGRFLSVDPARQDYSPYAAFGNNPVNRFDPTGGKWRFKNFIKKALPIVVGVVVGVALTVVTAGTAGPVAAILIAGAIGFAAGVAEEGTRQAINGEKMNVKSMLKAGLISGVISAATVGIGKIPFVQKAMSKVGSKIGGLFKGDAAKKAARASTRKNKAMTRLFKKYNGVKNPPRSRPSFEKWGAEFLETHPKRFNILQGEVLYNPNVVKSTISNQSKNVVPEGNLANHIFSGETNKLIDNPANRSLITDLTNNSKNYVGVDKYGKTWFARILDDGTQLYGYTQNGVVKGAGINPTPLDIFKTKGLK